jgi:hypothetical protein
MRRFSGAMAFTWVANQLRFDPRRTYKNELIDRKDKIQSTYANAAVKVKAK